jgi:hypothetical protein
MEFRPIIPKRPRSGSTLPELLVTLAVTGVVLAGLASFFIFSNRSFAAIANYAELSGQSRNAGDVLSRDIRCAIAVASFTSNQIVLRAADGIKITYTYDPVGRTLARAKGTTKRTLLKGVDSLDFSLYQRPATNAAYGKFAAATTGNTKLVAFRWICSRTIMGTKMDTESIQTAMIDLRNR